MEDQEFALRVMREEKACNQDNISLVLKEMNAITERKARFKTVISFFDGKEFKQFEGICNGQYSH
jgi:inosine/xanthosine triphosphate pyrophosphatase family protein